MFVSTKRRLISLIELPGEQIGLRYILRRQFRDRSGGTYPLSAQPLLVLTVQESSNKVRVRYVTALGQFCESAATLRVESNFQSIGHPSSILPSLHMGITRTFLSSADCTYIIVR
jgi:hypothetical protein